jgi:hypothetical protein
VFCFRFCDITFTQTDTEVKVTIDEYLAKVGSKVDDQYGRYFRSQFKDIKGTSELGMLASPSKSEFEQLKKAVAIMTPAEKEKATRLTDEEVQRIAADAGIDAAVFAIFMNGYVLELKRVSRGA